jgi:hypothetical protein
MLFRPFDRPSGEQLRPLWETLHDMYMYTAVGLWPPEDREASPDTMGIIAEGQRALSRPSAQARADALLTSFPPGTEDGKRARARLLSCACRLVGYPPTLKSCCAQKRGVPHRPPAPPWPCRASPQRSRCVMRL